MYPHFLIDVHVLRRPVGQVCCATTLHPDRQRSGEIARRYAVLLRPIVTLPVHRTLRERVATDDPLRLTLREIERGAVAAQSRRRGERFGLREQDAKVSAPREPDGKRAKIPAVTHRQSSEHLLTICIARRAV